MAVLYDFACPEHGRVEAFAGVGAQVAPCPVCGREAARRYSMPVVNDASFGRDMHRARTRPTDRRPQNDLQEGLIHDLRKRDRTHVQFGAGRTAGS